jgi:hypothetical protein
MSVPVSFPAILPNFGLHGQPTVAIALAHFKNAFPHHTFGPNMLIRVLWDLPNDSEESPIMLPKNQLITTNKTAVRIHFKDWEILLCNPVFYLIAKKVFLWAATMPFMAMYPVQYVNAYGKSTQVNLQLCHIVFQCIWASFHHLSRRLTFSLLEAIES